jgi:hypothetical protein
VITKARTNQDWRERLDDALAFRLQRHADRWIKKLQAEGFAVPDDITVYVDPYWYDVAAGWLDGSTGGVLGAANRRTRSVYVVPVDPWPGHDSFYCPIAVLVHELLHHDRKLLHWQVYWLADEFHAGTYGTTPMPEWISPEDASRLGIPESVIKQDLKELDDTEYPDPRERSEYWGEGEDEDEEID